MDRLYVAFADCHLLSHVAFQTLRRSCPDQALDLVLLDAAGGSVLDERSEICGRPHPASRVEDGADRVLAHVLHSLETESDLSVLYAVSAEAPVNIGRQDLYSHIAAVPYIQSRRLRVSHNAGKKSRHVLERIIVFEISSLIRYDRVSSRVRFVEGVLGEADHAVEDRLRYIPRHSVRYGSRDLDISEGVLLSVDEVFLFSLHLVHLLLGHHPADFIRPSVAVACKVADDLHDLLLVDDASVCDVEYGPQ